MNETLKNIKTILTGMGDTLTERERQVLEQRFGLVDGYSRTLEEVSRQFKTTTARIKEIEVRALAEILKYMNLHENGGVAKASLGGNKEHPQGDPLCSTRTGRVTPAQCWTRGGGRGTAGGALC